MPRGEVQPDGIQRPAGQGTQHEKGRVGAERDEDAMPEIDDVHEAEHEGEPEAIRKIIMPIAALPP